MALFLFDADQHRNRPYHIYYSKQGKSQRQEFLELKIHGDYLYAKLRFEKRMELIGALPQYGSTGINMELKELGKLTGDLAPSQTMPVLFMGHGSPMNAIEENEFVQGFREMGKDIPAPKAIICISAHWETVGTRITAMERPPTIHDFGGFPKALYEVQYPAPGDPSLAKETRELVKKTDIGLDQQWGLDHGAWSVIKHLYPKADIPVLELSLDRRQPPRYHYELAKEISGLRKKGVLLIGSGNMVHNLGMVDWTRLNDSYAFDWALEASTKMKEFILDGDHAALIDFHNQGRPFELAIPTPEHYLPLIYSLGLQNNTDQIQLFNDKPLAGSLSMTSIKFSQADR
jgi:4,5-DOPA dioxygenase extradiol